MTDTETRYQRLAREQAERQAARQKAMKKLAAPKRFRRHEDSRAANHIDGYDRDDLGESPDY